MCLIIETVNSTSLQQLFILVKADTIVSIDSERRQYAQMHTYCECCNSGQVNMHGVMYARLHKLHSRTDGSSHCNIPVLLWTHNPSHMPGHLYKLYMFTSEERKGCLHKTACKEYVNYTEM